MYRDSSNRSGDRSEITVELDLIRRGWIVCKPSSRDAVYDMVVDMGDRFETVQVKTMSGNSITRIVDRSGERVSAKGKVRNSLDYAKHGIDWLAGVSGDGNIYYYKLDTYSNIPSKSFSVNKYPSDEFPSNSVSNRHAKKVKKFGLLASGLLLLMVYGGNMNGNHDYRSLGSIWSSGAVDGISALYELAAAQGSKGR